jgi:hypothetical protein
MTMMRAIWEAGARMSIAVLSRPGTETTIVVHHPEKWVGGSCPLPYRPKMKAITTATMAATIPVTTRAIMTAITPEQAVGVVTTTMTMMTMTTVTTIDL